MYLLKIYSEESNNGEKRRYIEKSGQESKGEVKNKFEYVRSHKKYKRRQFTD